MPQGKGYRLRVTVTIDDLDDDSTAEPMSEFAFKWLIREYPIMVRAQRKLANEGIVAGMLDLGDEVVAAVIPG